MQDLNDLNLKVSPIPDNMLLPDIPVREAETEVGLLAMIPISALREFKDHPFLINKEDMVTLVESIKIDGVREPGIVFINEDGEYELAAGNRRKRACAEIGLTEMPVIVKKISRDDATILMLESNMFRRNKISPIEKAKALRMVRDALVHKGKHIVSAGPDDNTTEVLCKYIDESKNQVYRYIRLTYLIPGLQDLVAAKKLSVRAAVDISYLSPKLQLVVYDYVTEHKIKPTTDQSKELKDLYEDAGLDEEGVVEVLSRKPEEEMPAAEDKFPGILFSGEFCRKYFPNCRTPTELEEEILRMCKSGISKEITTV